MNLLDLARKLVDLLLDIVTPDVARQMLTDAAVRRANAVADLAEQAKFDTLPYVLPSTDDEP